MVSVGNTTKSQVDIKKYWDIDSKSQVGKCKLYALNQNYQLNSPGA